MNLTLETGNSTLNNVAKITDVNRSDFVLILQAFIHLNHASRPKCKALYGLIWVHYGHYASRARTPAYQLRKKGGRLLILHPNVRAQSTGFISRASLWHHKYVKAIRSILSSALLSRTNQPPQIRLLLWVSDKPSHWWTTTEIHF